MDKRAEATRVIVELVRVLPVDDDEDVSVKDAIVFKMFSLRGYQAGRELPGSP